MLECKWINFFEEEEKVDQIKDDEERNLRLTMLQEIMDKINLYNQKEEDYIYRKKWEEIIKRGVNLIEVNNSKTLKAKWSRMFASQISPETKKEIYYKSFKWHVFSYEKINALTRKKARVAFDRCKKSEVSIFYEHSDKAFLAENPCLLKSEDFDMDYDIYITDFNEQWTYIHTHETVQCGPYFYKIRDK